MDMDTRSEHLSLFLQSRRARGLSPKTLAFYQQQLGGFIVSGLDPNAYLVSLREKGNQPHAAARAIKAYTKWLAAQGLAPAVRFEMPRPNKPNRPCPTTEQIKSLLQAARKPRDKALLLLMVDSGLRRQEVCGLLWSDLDLNSGAITVRHGKGDKRRTTFIGHKTLSALLRLPQPHSGPVFHLSPAGLRMALERLGRRAGYPLSSHQLRRAFATQCSRNGVQPFQLQRMMGHASITTTMAYIALTTDDLAEAHANGSPIDRLG